MRNPTRCNDVSLLRGSQVPNEHGGHLRSDARLGSPWILTITWKGSDQGVLDKIISDKQWEGKGSKVKHRNPVVTTTGKVMEPHNTLHFIWW